METESNGYSLDELVQEYIREKQRSDEAYSRVRWLASCIAAHAAKERHGSNTAYVEDSMGQRLKVTFGQQTSFDSTLMLDVNKLLGPETFDQLFRTKVEFQAQKRALTMFLNTVSADERIETAKDLIRNAIRTEDKSPYVQVVE